MSDDGSYSSVSTHNQSSPCNFVLKGDGEFCIGCGEIIYDQYLLKVAEKTWHVRCLCCSLCHTPLDSQSSCFYRNDQIYCRQDYTSEFGTKCAKCLRAIASTDWVRRARDYVYHLACFACDSCKRQLSTGEEFALQDGKLLCKAHYLEVVEGGVSSSDESSQKQKTKRVRTTFSEDQIQVLQANFQLDSNPDGQDLERIALITGLSKRVTQVWFQNSRARQKKHAASNGPGGSSRSSPITSISGSLSPDNLCNSSMSNHFADSWQNTPTRPAELTFAS